MYNDILFLEFSGRTNQMSSYRVYSRIISATSGYCAINSSRTPLAGEGQGSDRTILNPGQRRMFILQSLEECRDPRLVPLHLRNQPRGIVQHPPRQLQPPRQIVDKRPEPDPLYNPP